MWCVELAREQWLPEYIEFETIVSHLVNHNKSFYDYGSIASCDKDLIFDLIKKKKSTMVGINFCLSFLFIDFCSYF